MIRRWLKIKRITAIAWVLRRYLRSRFFMGLLRRYPKLAWLPGTKVFPLIRLSVHHKDAVGVLDLDRNYAVPYLEKMKALGAPFMLGFDKSDAHTRQRTSVRRVLEPIALDQVGATSREAAEAALAGRTRIEVVHELTDAVLMATIGVHLGTGETTPRQLDAARMVFRHIFINPFNSPDVVEAAEADAALLLDHVKDIVEDRRAAVNHGAPYGDDVLGMLLRNMNDGSEPKLAGYDELTDQLVGLLVAWAASVSRSMAYTLDALLDQPAAMAKAHEVAVALAADPAAGDQPMWDVLTEAMRWQPPVPAIERVCMREGPVEGQTVRREREVWAVLTAVTMDKSRYNQPRTFNLDRTDQDNLTFGHQLHRCLGLPIARAQMSQIAIALLRRENVKRACRLQLVGPYPDRLDITFEGP
jgi:cytochrome P450